MPLTARFAKAPVTHFVYTLEREPDAPTLFPRCIRLIRSITGALLIVETLRNMRRTKVLLEYFDSRRLR